MILELEFYNFGIEVVSNNGELHICQINLDWVNQGKESDIEFDWLVLYDLSTFCWLFKARKYFYVIRIFWR